MTAITPGLAGHKGLRGDVLVELKRAQPVTATELAELFGVTTNAIRRHLKELEVEQLIEHVREQRGQGAPTHAFRLTDRGEALFPRRYDKELTAVLEFLERQSGRDAVRRFFEERFQSKADEILGRFGDAPFDERVVAVVEYLRQEGFMPDVSVGGEGMRLAEHNCAMHVVAQRYPEVCDTELTFLTTVLGPGVQRDRHIADGCNACEYAITTHGATDASATEEHA
ncbi:MAG: transcriptional regulator [Gemmatimonadota bacterium]|nr:transcriptional regulator [Gemmatimonadota bacterium]MDH4350020.1 transcriptional regulator [Gemmatimonadota bacterium]